MSRVKPFHLALGPLTTSLTMLAVWGATGQEFFDLGDPLYLVAYGLSDSCISLLALGSVFGTIRWRWKLHGTFIGIGVILVIHRVSFDELLQGDRGVVEPGMQLVTQMCIYAAARLRGWRLVLKTGSGAPEVVADIPGSMRWNLGDAVIWIIAIAGIFAVIRSYDASEFHFEFSWLSLSMLEAACRVFVAAIATWASLRAKSIVSGVIAVSLVLGLTTVIWYFMYRAIVGPLFNRPIEFWRPTLIEQSAHAMITLAILALFRLRGYRLIRWV